MVLKCTRIDKVIMVSLKIWTDFIFVSEFFQQGKLPTIRQLINFLEVYQMKDIQVVNLESLGFSQEKFAIVCSGFSAKHLHSTAKKLK